MFFFLTLGIKWMSNLLQFFLHRLHSNLNSFSPSILKFLTFQQIKRKNYYFTKKIYSTLPLVPFGAYFFTFYFYASLSCCSLYIMLGVFSLGNSWRNISFQRSDQSWQSRCFLCHEWRCLRGLSIEGSIYLFVYFLVCF